MNTAIPETLLPVAPHAAQDNVPAESEAAPPADPAREAEARYLAAMGALVDDANAHERLAILADVLAWTIARLVAGCGVGAAGDILRRIGGYVGDLVARRQAEEEAERERKEGRLPH